MGKEKGPLTFPNPEVVVLVDWDGDDLSVDIFNKDGKQGVLLEPHEQRALVKFINDRMRKEKK